MARVLEVASEVAMVEMNAEMAEVAEVAEVVELVEVAKVKEAAAVSKNVARQEGKFLLKMNWSLRCVRFNNVNLPIDSENHRK